eukprot:gene86-108_t
MTFVTDDETELAILGGNLRQIPEAYNWDNYSKINLHGNFLQSLKGFPKLLNLRVLNLSSNNFSEANLDEIVYLPKLQVLDLSSNFINDLSKLPYLPNIQEFYISFNLLKSVVGINNFPNIERLDLRGNYLASLADVAELRTLPHLSSLSLLSHGPNENPICGSIQDMLNIFSLCNNLSTLDGEYKEVWCIKGCSKITPKFDKIMTNFRKKFLIDRRLVESENNQEAISQNLASRGLGRNSSGLLEHSLSTTCHESHLDVAAGKDECCQTDDELLKNGTSTTTFSSQSLAGVRLWEWCRWRMFRTTFNAFQKMKSVSVSSCIKETVDSNIVIVSDDDTHHCMNCEKMKNEMNALQVSAGVRTRSVLEKKMAAETRRFESLIRRLHQEKQTILDEAMSQSSLLQETHSARLLLLEDELVKSRSELLEGQKRNEELASRFAEEISGYKEVLSRERDNFLKVTTTLNDMTDKLTSWESNGLLSHLEKRCKDLEVRLGESEDRVLALNHRVNTDRKSYMSEKEKVKEEQSQLFQEMMTSKAAVDHQNESLRSELKVAMDLKDRAEYRLLQLHQTFEEFTSVSSLAATTAREKNNTQKQVIGELSDVIRSLKTANRQLLSKCNLMEREIASKRLLQTTVSETTATVCTTCNEKSKDVKSTENETINSLTKQVIDLSVAIRVKDQMLLDQNESVHSSRSRLNKVVESLEDSERRRAAVEGSFRQLQEEFSELEGVVSATKKINKRLRNMLKDFIGEQRQRQRPNEQDETHFE